MLEVEAGKFGAPNHGMQRVLSFSGMSGITAFSTAALTSEGLELLRYAGGSSSDFRRSNTIADFELEEQDGDASAVVQLRAPASTSRERREVHLRSPLPPAAPFPRLVFRRSVTLQPSSVPHRQRQPPWSSSSGSVHSSDHGDWATAIRALLPRRYGSAHGLSSLAVQHQEGGGSGSGRPSGTLRRSRTQRFGSALALDVLAEIEEEHSGEEERTGGTSVQPNTSFTGPSRIEASDLDMWSSARLHGQLTAEALFDHADAIDDGECDPIQMWLLGSDFSVPPLGMCSNNGAVMGKQQGDKSKREGVLWW